MLCILSNYALHCYRQMPGFLTLKHCNTCSWCLQHCSTCMHKLMPFLQLRGSGLHNYICGFKQCTAWHISAPLHLQELLVQQEQSWEPPCVSQPLASTCLFEMHRFSRFPPRVHFNHVLLVTWLAHLLQELQQLQGIPGLSCTSEGIATQQGKNNAHDNCTDLHQSN